MNNVYWEIISVKVVDLIVRVYYNNQDETAELWCQALFCKRLKFLKRVNPLKELAISKQFNFARSHKILAF